MSWKSWRQWTAIGLEAGSYWMPGGLAAIAQTTAEKLREAEAERQRKEPPKSQD